MKIWPGWRVWAEIKTELPPDFKVIQRFQDIDCAFHYQVDQSLQMRVFINNFLPNILIEAAFLLGSSTSHIAGYTRCDTRVPLDCFVLMNKYEHMLPVYLEVKTKFLLSFNE